jgi:hypothetical protein
MKTGRIDAIDFWRGFALLSIFANHLSDNIFAALTHRNFGFSDAAELFVFLAGISVALAYGRRFLAGQMLQAVRGAYKRMLSLYAVQIAVSLVGIAVLITAAILLDDDDFIEDPDRDLILEAPLRSIVALFGLAHQFGFFNILPLYIVLLLIAPALLALARFDRRLMLAASAALYMASRAFSWHLPTWPLEGEWFFNPFAWQFVFAIGLFVGLRLEEPPAYRAWLYWPCAAFVAASAFVVTDAFSLWPDLWNGLRGAFDHDKTALGSLRIAHFLALIYVVQHSRLTGVLRRTPAYAPLAVIGRHSLPVFATGALLVVFGEVLTEIDIPEQMTGFVFVILGTLIQYGVARAFEARRQARRAPMAAAGVTASAPAFGASPPLAPELGKASTLEPAPAKA